MWELEISHIAGLYSAETTLNPGTTVVQASNWQGKTSFVTALRTVLGGEPTSNTITTGETEGKVTLRTSDDVYTVTVTRTDGIVTRTGAPYVTDERTQAASELFAFLDGDNKVRAAVRNGEDLTPLLLQPLEHDDIDARIADRKSERNRLQSELQRATEAAETLSRKKTKQNELKAELDELRVALADLEDVGSGTDSDLRQDRNDLRSQREHLEQSIDRHEQEISSIQSELETKRDRLDTIELPSESGFADEIEAKRERLTNEEQEIETLKSVYNANKRILEQDHLDMVTDVERRLDGDRIGCWVCGAETGRAQVEDQFSALSDLISERQATIETLREEVSELEAKRDRINAQKREQTDLESRIASLEERLAERRDDLADTREELTEVSARLADIVDDIEETDQKRSDMEADIARTEAHLETVQEECASLRQEADRREQLRSQIETITDEIEELRTRRERLIDDARAAFEAALEAIVSELQPSFQAARLDKHVDPDTGKTTNIELVIARDGRRVSVAELSEGEVELVGFIAALAGYKAYEITDEVPCLILDEVGGLASDNLGDLIDYLEDQTKYLVTTAYPEADDLSGQAISPQEWTVVSD